MSCKAHGKKQNCLTLAITNEAKSPLAEAADFLLDIQAGKEEAVAATKTYTTELMSIAMLSTALNGKKTRWAELAEVPGWMKAVLKHDALISRSAERYRYMDQTVVLGRGFNYSTAFEWALKLKELAYVKAEPYSSADFQHGPIAMMESGFPVMAVAPRGKVFESMLEMLKRLRKELSAELVVISNDKKALSLASLPLPIPADVPEWLSPMICILPAQIFTYHSTQAKGYNTEQPRSIHKETETT